MVDGNQQKHLLQSFAKQKCEFIPQRTKKHLSNTFPKTRPVQTAKSAKIPVSHFLTYRTALSAAT